MSRRARRKRSLAWPLHELRGALTAIHLGLSKDARGKTEGLLLQLDRARFALDDLDAFVEGRRMPRAEGIEQLVDLRALVQRGVRAWSPLAPCYGARLRSSWRAGEVRVRGRPVRLAQALDNLIANAVEHGLGEVEIAGEVVGNRVRIAIADEGRGVSSSRLCEASPRSRRGHGLAISRAAVTEHGGQLLFEQRESGSAVVIELPLAEGDATAAARRDSSPSPVPAGSGARRAA